MTAPCEAHEATSNSPLLAARRISAQPSRNPVQHIVVGF